MIIATQGNWSVEWPVNIVYTQKRNAHSVACFGCLIREPRACMYCVFTSININTLHIPCIEGLFPLLLVLDNICIYLYLYICMYNVHQLGLLTKFDSPHTRSIEWKNWKYSNRMKEQRIKIGRSLPTAVWININDCLVLNRRSLQ